MSFSTVAMADENLGNEASIAEVENVATPEDDEASDIQDAVTTDNIADETSSEVISLTDDETTEEAVQMPDGEITPIQLSGENSEINFTDENYISDIQTIMSADDLEKDLNELNINSVPAKPSPVLKGNSRASGNLTGDTYTFSRTLTSDDPEDYFFFSRTTSNTALAQINSTNSNYVLMLCVVDYSTNTIYYTNTYVFANQLLAITLPTGDYAWNIFSNSGVVGQDYTMNFNATLPAGSTNALYVSDDLQKIYTMGGGKLKMNNVAQNINYSYYYYSNIPLYPSGYDWSKIDIKLTDPYANGSVHIGGFKYKKGSSWISYPNAIVIPVGTGGRWYHEVSSGRSGLGSTYDYRDMAGRTTPRPIDSYDIQIGENYLVYDIDAGKVQEFCSGLNYEWYYGKHSPETY